MKFLRGFTLLELIIVIMIVGILSALAMPQYTKARERALVKEARANLKLMGAAEKIYRMEYGGYYPVNGGVGEITDLGTINTNLKLSLNEINWDYSVLSFGNPSTSVNVYARRLSGPYSNCGYVFSIPADIDAGIEPRVNSGTCP